MSNITPEGRFMFHILDKQEADAIEADRIKHRLEHEKMSGLQKWLLTRRYNKLLKRVAYYERGLNRMRETKGL